MACRNVNLSITCCSKDADPDKPLWAPSYYPRKPEWRENIGAYFDEKQFTSLVSGFFAHLAKIELFSPKGQI
jgi:hypothetical protein